MAITRTERLGAAAERLGIPIRELLELIDTGKVAAVKTAQGHLEVAADLALPDGH